MLFGRRALVGLVAVATVLIGLHEALTRRTYEAAIAALGTLDDNTLPSVVEVGEIRQLVDELERDLGRPEGRERLRKRWDSLWAEVEVHETAYSCLPTLPTEHELQRELRPRLDRLKRAGQAVLDAPDDVTADALFAREQSFATHEALARLQDLIELNARAGADAAQDIVRGHARASVLSTAFLIGHLLLLGTIAVLVSGSLSRADQLVEQRMAELDRFAARAAHDMKGPLTTALLASGALRRGGDPSQLRRNQTTIESSLKRAGALVDAFLDFARAAARPASGARADVDGVVAELEPGLRLLAESERAVLTLDVERGLEAAVSRAALASILENVAAECIPLPRRVRAARGRDPGIRRGPADAH